MAPGTGGGEHSQQVDLRGRGRRFRPRICCCRRDSRPQGRHLRHHAYQRCARYEVENWRIARIAKWLSSGGQTTSGPATTTGSPGLKWSYCYGCHHGCNPGLKLHIFEEEAFSTILFCGNCCHHFYCYHHFYCNPGLKLPSCSFEEDSCGWNSVIELNATKWFHFQRLIDINWYIGTCLNQNLSKKTPLPSFSTTGSISRYRFSEIIQISIKTFITIDQDKWKRSPARHAGSRHGPQPRQQRW